MTTMPPPAGGADVHDVPVRGAADPKEHVYISRNVAVDDAGNDIVRVVLLGERHVPEIGFQLDTTGAETLGRALLGASWASGNRASALAALIDDRGAAARVAGTDMPAPPERLDVDLEPPPLLAHLPPGWRTAQDISRDTLCLLHPSGLWVEVSRAFDLCIDETIAVAIAAELAQGVEQQRTGLHLIETSRDGSAATARLILRTRGFP